MIHADRWRPSDGLSLEPNALAAAREAEHNLALTAGPGAGKTEMLAQRADFLLRTRASRYPKRILAISFKVDASRNLKARVRKRCDADLAARLDSYTFHAFAKRIMDRFRTALQGRDALDADYSIGTHRVDRRAITFADMIPLAISIVESNPIARKAIRQTYSHVFLDEFQDCTEAQYHLIKACFHGTRARLTAVGDTKQRIMGFAGALEGIFQMYADDFDAVPLNLYQNFRSKPRLRRAQNAMVRVMDAPAALNDDELEGDEGEIEVLRFENDDDEADYLANAVRQWIEEEDLDPREIAILVRSQPSLYCKKIRDAFDAQGVPSRQEDTMQDLASEPVAAMIVDFLLIVSRTRDPAPYRRLLDLMVFNQGSEDEREYRLRSRWDRFVADVALQIAIGVVDLSERSDLEGLVDELIEFVGRDAVVALSADYGNGNRMQQLVTQTIDRAHELLVNAESTVEALLTFSGDRAVRIMSIHKSKGLEFDTVVVFGVENQAFRGGDDERAAFFVAISRAKRRLYLTACSHRERPDGANFWRSARTEREDFIDFVEPYS